MNTWNLRTKTCPPRDQLASLFTEHLDSAQREAVEDHVGACTECQKRLEQLAVGSADWDSWDKLLRTEVLSWPAAKLSPSKPQHSSNWPSVPGYEILGILGRGGMGIVYKAKHEALGRLVALKTFRATDQSDSNLRHRLEAEAATLAQLQHPNVVQIYEILEHEGYTFLALELITGSNLADYLKRHIVSPTEAARIVEVLAQAMSEVHALGILHRDLKPANVLLQGVESAASLENEETQPSDPNEREATHFRTPQQTHPASGASTLAVVKITDFGLAHREHISGGTKTGELMGTPSYVAPEQAQGLPGWSTPAVDIYGLGAILYELLTGVPPFRAESTLETLQQVVHRDPVPPSWLRPKLSRDLETICLKCLQKNPTQRYASSLALAEDLRRFQKGEPVRARPTPWWSRTFRWIRRHPWVSVLAVCLCAVVLAFVGVWANYVQNLGRLNSRLLARAQEAEAKTQEARDNAKKAKQNEQKANEAKERAKFERRRTTVAVSQILSTLRRQAEALRGSANGKPEALTPFQRRLLKTTMESYARVLARQDYPELRLEQSRNHAWLGKVYLEAKQYSKASYHWQRAVQLRETLEIQKKRSPEKCTELGGLLVYLGSLQTRTNEPKEAERTLRRAIRILDQAKDVGEDNTNLTFRRAMARVELARTMVELQKGQEVLNLLHSARKLLRTIPSAEATPKSNGLLQFVERQLVLIGERKKRK